MATMQVELLGIRPDSNEIDLSLLVKEATWKDILVDLVHKNQFDPWNIDLVELVDRYIDTVKKLKVMDLRIPANIILASAVLLRLKSEVLTINEPDPTDTGDIAQFERPQVQVNALSLRLRPQVKRKVSLIELIHALEEAMVIKERRAASMFPEKIDVPITLSKIDIAEEVEKLYGTIKKHADKEQMTTFSYLSKAAGFSDVLLEFFIPLLFLAYKERVLLIQEEFFGDIVIKIN